jgi:hypothetical protein
MLPLEKSALSNYTALSESVNVDGDVHVQMCF